MPLHSPPTKPAKKLAWQASAWVLGVAAIIGLSLYIAVSRSDMAQRDVKVVDRQANRNTVRARENRRLILGYAKLTRQVERLLRAQTRTVRANRKRIRAQGRVLVRSGIAEMAEGGTIRIRQGAVGAVGATGATGAAGSSAPVVTAQQLTDVFAPLLPPAVALLCEGSCDGPPGRDGSDGKDAPPPSQEQVTAAHLALCQSKQIECAVPGPQGPPGEKGERGDPGPVVTTSTATFDCLPDPDPLASPGAMVCTARP